jgi:hypothetical protein
MASGQTLPNGCSRLSRRSRTSRTSRTRPIARRVTVHAHLSQQGEAADEADVHSCHILIPDVHSFM